MAGGFACCRTAPAWVEGGPEECCGAVMQQDSARCAVPVLLPSGSWPWFPSSGQLGQGN